MSGSLRNRIQVYSEELHFDSEAEMIDCIAESMSSGEKIGVLAGHFMLCYDVGTDALVPMIWQDLRDTDLVTSAKRFAGNFPIRSFDCGVRLAVNIQGQGAYPKIIMLVNDHKFQTGEFDPTQFEAFHGRGGELRRDFYKRYANLPASLEQIRMKLGVDSSILLENNSKKRSRQDILPEETTYFSEQVLRRKFERKTRQFMQSLPEVVEAPNKGPRSELLLLANGGLGAGAELCLTEEGACGCSGETVQLLLELDRKNRFSQLVLLVPDECEWQVKGGVLAGMHLHDQLGLEGLKTVCVISGLGGSGQHSEDTMDVSDLKLARYERCV